MCFDVKREHRGQCQTRVRVAVAQAHTFPDFCLAACPENQNHDFNRVLDGVGLLSLNNFLAISSCKFNSASIPFPSMP